MDTVMLARFWWWCFFLWRFMVHDLVMKIPWRGVYLFYGHHHRSDRFFALASYFLSKWDCLFYFSLTRYNCIQSKSLIRSAGGGLSCSPEFTYHILNSTRANHRTRGKRAFVLPWHRWDGTAHGRDIFCADPAVIHTSVFWNCHIPLSVRLKGTQEFVKPECQKCNQLPDIPLYLCQGSSPVTGREVWNVRESWSAGGLVLWAGFLSYHLSTVRFGIIHLCKFLILFSLIRF